MIELTLSSKHSVPANIAPIRAKFLARDFPLSNISLSACLVDMVAAFPGSPTMVGSRPAVSNPRAPPNA